MSEGRVRNELTLGHQLHDDSLKQPLQSWYFQQRRVSSSDAFCMTCIAPSSTNAFMFTADRYPSYFSARVLIVSLRSGPGCYRAVAGHSYHHSASIQ